jgi:glycosyltransferase involved in cell wall biosynthesis
MRLRVIDLLGNIGGGERFLLQMIRVLLNCSDDLEIELYGNLANSRLFYRIKMINPMRISIKRDGVCQLLSDRLAMKLERIAKLWLKIKRDYLRNGWTLNVSPKNIDDADIIWFPWAMRHRIANSSLIPEHKIVATYHDTILIDIDGVVPDHWRKEEIETARQWMKRNCHLIFTSRNTLKMLENRFGPRLDHWSLIRLAADHRVVEGEPDRLLINKMPQNYIICPANISPHKNHEILLQGLAPFKNQFSLVLTGHGSDLKAPSGRSKELVDLATSLGYKFGESLFPLGYVSEVTYDELLKNASLLVMPTLAEGGGSWPVFEALLMGKQVVVSDIPVMREFAEAFEVPNTIWFDPTSAASLTNAIREYCNQSSDSGSMKNHGDLSKLNRSWSEVGREHFDLFMKLWMSANTAKTK